MTLEERRQQILNECKTVVTDRKIVIEPHISFYESESTIKDKLDVMMKDIWRHVDNVDSIDLVETTIKVCKHCGLEMEFEEGTSIPSCCEIMQWNHGNQ